MNMKTDSIVLDWRELQLKWAEDKAADTLYSLIPLIERIKDEELLLAINDWLQAVHDYVVTVERIRKSAAPIDNERE